MVLGASLVVSDSSALDAPVSSNLSARSLAGSDSSLVDASVVF